MSFFAEVKVGRDRVLEEMNDEITNKDQQRRASPTKFQTVGNDFNDRGGEHEARAQGDKIFEVRAVPVLLDDDGAAENIRGGRGRPEQQAEQDGMHREWRMI